MMVNHMASVAIGFAQDVESQHRNLHQAICVAQFFHAVELNLFTPSSSIIRNLME
jgi:hypothetical protein